MEQPNSERSQMATDLAIAILMVEVSRADFKQDESEMQKIRDLTLENNTKSGENLA